MKREGEKGKGREGKRGGGEMREGERKGEKGLSKNSNK
jgi:hypothetical protein